jgi:transcriptional regulator with XRE-family HTH domain
VNSKTVPPKSSCMSSNLSEKLKAKDYRDAFVSSQMLIPFAFQILALREQRGMTQKQLAEKAGMLQPRIAAMERPSGSEVNLRTLKRLASAFDVALIVRFVPFSELVEWAENFSPDTFVVPSFSDDPIFHQPESKPEHSTARQTVSEEIPINLIKKSVGADWYPPPQSCESSHEILQSVEYTNVILFPIKRTRKTQHEEPPYAALGGLAR